MKQSIALSLVEGIGSRHMRKLLDTFGSAAAVMEADIEQLMSAGLPLRLAQRVASHASEARARSVLDLCERTGVRVLTSEMDAFPRAFAECPDAPCVLYVRGDIDFNNGHWLSVVGTRNATPGGTAATERVVRDLSLRSSDTVIVSGLAFGIDKAAHVAALKYRLRTVAIMAGWVDDIVPRSHYYLARQILESGGAIVSDMPPGTVIDRGNFLSRNRLIAGLSAATIVVESAARGGSLVTADIASSYHKELFALPGPIDAPASEGTNMLIRSNKAILYQSAEDVWDTLNWSTEPPRATTEAPSLSALTERQRMAYEAFPERQRLDAETLADLWQVPLWEASSLVGQLRAKGLVAVDPYKCYYKI
ncbi:DNA-processing protein DprA [uncultured Rikenella sp.]|uniref:DNA-processing protein DprA n=1 Tax=uncultured Rikenella sp. TaxID=368003 RepID=UPI00261E82CB|nr:DNA-processing protein DprA [uncultured Rikenella sp.]